MMLLIPVVLLISSIRPALSFALMSTNESYQTGAQAMCDYGQTNCTLGCHPIDHEYAMNWVDTFCASLNNNTDSTRGCLSSVDPPAADSPCVPNYNMSIPDLYPNSTAAPNGTEPNYLILSIQSARVAGTGMAAYANCGDIQFGVRPKTMAAHEEFFDQQACHDAFHAYPWINAPNATEFYGGWNTTGCVRIFLYQYAPEEACHVQGVDIQPPTSSPESSPTSSPTS